VQISRDFCKESTLKLGCPLVAMGWIWDMWPCSNGRGSSRRQSLQYWRFWPTNQGGILDWSWWVRGWILFRPPMPIGTCLWEWRNVRGMGVRKSES
jgi:hypothetical protein